MIKLLLKREGAMKGKLILGTIVLALVMLGPLSCAQPKSEPEGKSIPFITPMEIRDPDIAQKYGIRGYLDVNLSAESPEVLYIKRGEAANIIILLHFVSYVPELTEIEVNIDPKKSDYTMEQYYGIGDAQGNVIGEGVIKVNELISYSPNGTITMKADETLPITMTIRVLADLPEGIMRPSFRLGAVGIMTDVFVLSDIGKLEVMIPD
jgi:hypothetical protein